LVEKKDQRNPRIAETLLPARPDDILELDEVWSFVLKKKNKRWLWTAICRRTRQIVGYVIGDRSETTCRQLWQSIPDTYKHCFTYSDFWEAYANVFPEESHQCVGKQSGQTNHMERWNNTLRQWNARYTRKTLSFSKKDFYHDLVTRIFIVRYNLTKLSLTT
jgi:insertion element IS1 protein InsB